MPTASILEVDVGYISYLQKGETVRGGRSTYSVAPRYRHACSPYSINKTSGLLASYSLRLSLSRRDVSQRASLPGETYQNVFKTAHQRPTCPFSVVSFDISSASVGLSLAESSNLNRPQINDGSSSTDSLESRRESRLE